MNVFLIPKSKNSKANNWLLAMELSKYPKNQVLTEEEIYAYFKEQNVSFWESIFICQNDSIDPYEMLNNITLLMHDLEIQVVDFLKANSNKNEAALKKLFTLVSAYFPSPDYISKDLLEYNTNIIKTLKIEKYFRDLVSKKCFDLKDVIVEEFAKQHQLTINVPFEQLKDAYIKIGTILNNMFLKSNAKLKN